MQADVARDEPLAAESDRGAGPHIGEEASMMTTPSDRGAAERDGESERESPGPLEQIAALVLSQPETANTPGWWVLYAAVFAAALAAAWVFGRRALAPRLSADSATKVCNAVAAVAAAGFALWAYNSLTNTRDAKIAALAELVTDRELAGIVRTVRGAVGRNKRSHIILRPLVLELQRRKMSWPADAEPGPSREAARATGPGGEGLAVPAA